MLGNAAHAESILLGSDYLETLPGTFFDFGSPIGSVPLRGLPVNPGVLGTTDTIVQRRADAILPGVGSTTTVPIELVQLSLVSVNPVTIGPLTYDVFVHLTPSTTSIGTMTIRHEFPDNGTSVPEGTFDSFFDVFFTADFTEVGNPLNTFSVPGTARMEASGAPWSHEPMLPAALLVTGLAGDQNANDHTSRPPLFSDDHVQQVLHTKVLGGPGVHLVGPAFAPDPFAVPEPSTLLLGVIGFGWLAAAAGKRRPATL
jgi:hypothetical protein